MKWIWILLYKEKPFLETTCVAYKTCPLICSTRCLLYNNIYYFMTASLLTYLTTHCLKKKLKDFYVTSPE